MKYITYTTDDPEFTEDDDSIEAKFYRKHNFKEIFDSYLSWGPLSIEIHCHLTPAKKKLIVDSMYYTKFGIQELDKKKKAPRDHVEMLCEVFDLSIKRK